ncbi:MAG: hypothetical protein ACOYMD_08630, partial [Paludibacter sp.]
MKTKIKILSFTLMICIFTKAQIEAPCYTAFKANPATSVLPDYSYSGYKLGADSIPNVNLPIFNVTNYGAIPDDGKEDFDAVQTTINAAVAAGG